MTSLRLSIFSPELGEVHVTPQANTDHIATVVFLHGSGNSGPGVKSSLEEALGKNFVFDYIRILYPNAPEQPYTPLLGEKSHVWFDRRAVKASAEEDTKSVDQMAQKIYTFIKNELVAKGTPYGRIIIGGFSMGGAMALHMAYRYCPQIAGVFTLSSFLNFDSAVYENLKTKHLSSEFKVPPLFSCQGDCDDVVSFEDGEQTYLKLTELGVKGQFHKFKGMNHEQWKNEILMLHDWIEDILKNSDRHYNQEL